MGDWLPSLNALRAFETVSRHLNYRQAADELHVTPAAVKQLVGKLEDAVGTSLLEKRGRGLALTPAGAAVSNDLSRAFRQITDSVEKVRMMAGRQRLIVSVDPSFAAAWLVPRLEVFRIKNPDIDVLIDSSMQIVDLDRSDADIALRFGVPSDDSLVTHRLFDEQLCAFCSPSLAKGPPGINRLQDLERVTLLRWDLSQFEWASNTRKWNSWKHWLAQIGASHITPGKGLRFNDYNLAVQAAIAGQGIVLGSWPILQSLVEANLLITPFPETAITGIGYDLVTTKKALDRDEVRSFLEWINEEVH